MQGGDNSNVLQAGLPNITGRLEAGNQNYNIATGVFYYIEDTGTTLDGSRFNLNKVGLDASRSSSIYGASNTVQPPALVLLPQIKY